MNIREVINHDTLIDDKKKRVCAYARVSTLKDTAHNSFDTQVKTYTDFILSNPSWQFAGVYADEGKSGTNYDSRPQFKLMIEVARNKMIDLIITKSTSRFARNTIDCLSILNQLKEWGTEVWFENENISSFDPKIEFVISVLSGIAEEGARNVSENVKWNVRNRFKEGKFYVVTKRFMGYTHDENGNLVIVEEEAKVVKKIFDMYTSGSSIPSIIKWLESNHIKTVLGKDKWYRGAIIGIVKNEKYTGNALLQKTLRPNFRSKQTIKNDGILPQYLVQNSHPAIITQEQFDKAQLIRNERIKKYHKPDPNDKEKFKNKYTNKTIYSGFVYCPYCNNNFHFKINNQYTPYANRILICKSNKLKKTCSQETLFCDVFDRQIINQINMIIKNKEVFLSSLLLALKSDDRVIAANKKLKRTCAKLEGINEKIKAYNFKNDDFSINVLNKLKEQQAEIIINKTNIENELLTTLNVDTFYEKIKNQIKPYKNKIEDLNEFPFRELFSKVIVVNRNKIIFVIGWRDDYVNIDLDSDLILEIDIKYLIRKTEHTSKQGIIFF